MSREYTFIIWKKWIQQFIYEYVTSKKKKKRIMILISRHPYLLLDMVRQYPELNWDRISISRSRQIQERNNFIYFQGSKRFNFVRWENNPKGTVRLTYHPQLSIALVLRYHYVGWDYKFLLLYRLWTNKQIERLIQKRRMDWCVYSKNPFINIDTVRYFLRYPWDWNHLAIHPSFPPQEVYLDNILFSKWKWRSVFLNPRISLEFWEEMIKKHPNVYNDSSILLHNYFQHDSNLQIWATFHIHEFMIRHLIVNRRIWNKLKLLLYLKKKMLPELINHTISYL